VLVTHSRPSRREQIKAFECADKALRFLDGWPREGSCRKRSTALLCERDDSKQQESPHERYLRFGFYQKASSGAKDDSQQPSFVLRFDPCSSVT
jgi:hypothetical protein